MRPRTVQNVIKLEIETEKTCFNHFPLTVHSLLALCDERSQRIALEGGVALIPSLSPPTPVEVAVRFKFKFK